MKISVHPDVAAQIRRTKDDFIVETKRGSGNGGQNRNVRDTCVKITDKITGLTADICDERTQPQNKRKAFLVLVERLVAHYTQQTLRDRSPSHEVRVYKEPSDTVRDHLTGKKASYRRVINGELDLLR